MRAWEAYGRVYRIRELLLEGHVDRAVEVCEGLMELLHKEIRVEDSSEN